MLILSAIKTTENEIYVGKRHNNIIKDNKNIDFVCGIQGFMDINGKFYNRKQAFKIAYKNKQIKNNCMIGGILTSEDVW